MSFSLLESQGGQWGKGNQVLKNISKDLSSKTS